MMRKRVSLAAKISTALVGLLLLAVASGAVAILSAYQFEQLLDTLVEENLASVRAAEELEIALLEQRGYVASYILDHGQGDWLDRLQQQSLGFDDWLAKARRAAHSTEQRVLLDRLEAFQDAYAQKREYVVQLYDSGQEEQARQMLLHDVLALYGQCYDLCEEFIRLNESLVILFTADSFYEGYKSPIVDATVIKSADLSVLKATIAQLLPAEHAAESMRHMAASPSKAAGLSVNAAFFTEIKEESIRIRELITVTGLWLDRGLSLLHQREPFIELLESCETS